MLREQGEGKSREERFEQYLAALQKEISPSPNCKKKKKMPRKSKVKQIELKKNSCKVNITTWEKWCHFIEKLIFFPLNHSEMDKVYTA